MKTQVMGIIDFLELKHPVSIKLVTKIPRKYRQTMGYHYALKDLIFQRIIKHEIRVFLPNLEGEPRGLNSIIAHELAHAWVEEKYPKLKKHHGAKFQFICGILEAEFGLKNLYLPGVDVN